MIRSPEARDWEYNPEPKPQQWAAIAHAPNPLARDKPFVGGYRPKGASTNTLFKSGGQGGSRRLSI